MFTSRLTAALALFLSLSLLTSLSAQPPSHPHPEFNHDLNPIASSTNQWTGVAVSNNSRIFVNFPYWSDNVPVSVAEIIDGKPVPYPNTDWQSRSSDSPHFIAVQSVFVDDNDNLWVLDTNNPLHQGVQTPGPVLHQFNLQTNTLTKSYTFPSTAYRPNSYFNDVRIDTDKQVAYITDSGQGAIVVLNLQTNSARRLLDTSPSTQPETDYLIINGKKWSNSVASDGIALTPDKQYLYYIALTGHTLYRIPTSALLDTTLSAKQLNDKVQTIMAVPATDGMLFDNQGNLYLGGLENNAINIIKPDGNLFQLIQSAEIKWADSFAKDPKGHIFFTTSQINLPPDQRENYMVYAFNPPQLLGRTAEPLNSILIAVTSHPTLGNTGKPTGYFLSEVSHAYYTFKAAGFNVKFVSPQGGTVPVTGKDTQDTYNIRFLNDPDAQAAIKETLSPQQVTPHHFRAIYYAGGHGTMWDFPDNKPLQDIATKIYEFGGVVSAVCHGPAGLVNIKLSNDQYLISGKEISAFTNEEEQSMNLDNVVPFPLETKLKERGANFRKVDNFQPISVTDDRIVTGQNPASALSVAEETVHLLKAPPSHTLQPTQPKPSPPSN
ncbi:DJ-1/PfpI family protein [Planctomycetota bacterium]|nr:DJ-1/PfpI family protein [Planctomycetota bacterium]